MQKFTLVPDTFFSNEEAYRILSESVHLSASDKVYYKELPRYKAVLVYAADAESDIPAIASLIDALSAIADHNKVAASTDGSTVSIAIAEGDRLLLANTYPAPDVVTAEYFIFATLKQFQLNPEITTVYLQGKTPYELQNDLFHYFKGVEKI